MPATSTVTAATTTATVRVIPAARAFRAGRMLAERLGGASQNLDAQTLSANLVEELTGRVCKTWLPGQP